LTSRKQAQTRDYASAGSCVFALGHRFSADASALSKSQAEIFHYFRHLSLSLITLLIFVDY